MAIFCFILSVIQKQLTACNTGKKIQGLVLQKLNARLFHLFLFFFGYFYLLCDCLQCSNFCAALYEEAHVQACRHTYLGSIKDKNCKNCKMASVYKVFTPWIVSEKFRKDSAVKKLITIEMRGALFCNFRNLRLKIENSKRMKYKISLVKKVKGT